MPVPPLERSSCQPRAAAAAPSFVNTIASASAPKSAPKAGSKIARDNTGPQWVLASVPGVATAPKSKGSEAPVTLSLPCDIDPTSKTPAASPSAQLHEDGDLVGNANEPRASQSAPQLREGGKIHSDAGLPHASSSRLGDLGIGHDTTSCREAPRSDEKPAMITSLACGIAAAASTMSASATALGEVGMGHETTSCCKAAGAARNGRLAIAISLCAAAVESNGNPPEMQLLLLKNSWRSAAGPVGEVVSKTICPMAISEENSKFLHCEAKTSVGDEKFDSMKKGVVDIAAN